MRFWVVCLLALFLSWPAYAADLTLELECHPSELVKQTIRSGEIAPVAFGMNDNEEMVILWKMLDGRFWISWMKSGEDVACTLGAGPVWMSDQPGAPL